MEGSMFNQKKFSILILLLIFAVFLFTACNANSVSQASFTPTPSFKPGDPTATPLGSEITNPSYIEGLEAYKAASYSEVVTLMSAAIKADPNSAPPYRYRGIAYWYLDDCASGFADAEKALSINPDYAEAWAIHGLLNECLGNTSQSLQDYQKALSIDPSLAFVHHNLAVHYSKSGDYENSLNEYRLAVAIDPYRTKAWSGEIKSLTNLGRYDDCIITATTALEVNPENWIVYADRALCEMKLSKFVEAVEDYKVYASREDVDDVIWYNMGVAQHESGDTLGAIASYTNSINLNPSYYSVFVNRGNAYLDITQYEDALNDFNSALNIGNLPSAYSGRGDAYLGLEMYDEAIADYEMSISLMSNEIHPHPYCFLALAYFAAGRYQDSIDTAEISQQIDPECGGQRLIEAQARSFYALGEYDQGLLYINKAIDMKPYSLGYYYRGIMLHDAGRNYDAIQDLEKFLSLIPSNEDFLSEIADANARIAILKP